jgi:hypothetical protein
MRIVLIGNHQVGFSTEADWAWTYEDMGHEVFRHQENIATTEDIWEDAQKSDIVHYVHTHGWSTPGQMPIQDVLSRCKQAGIPTVGIHLDYWYGLERQKDVGVHPWWDCDYIFTADGGSNDWYREKGINHFYLPAGVCKRDCHIGEYNEKYECDVAFVGSYGYHPEWPYRPRLIDWLQDTYGDRFRRFAGDVDPPGTVRGKDLNDLYATVKVVVGDTLCLGFNHPNYFSDRLFETTGRGGFLIFPHIEGIDDCFVTDLSGSFQSQIELVEYEYENFAQLKRQIDRYVADEAARERISLAGYQRTLRDHTYHNRAEQVFAQLKKDGVLDA